MCITRYHALSYRIFSMLMVHVASRQAGSQTRSVYTVLLLLLIQLLTLLLLTTLLTGADPKAAPKAVNIMTEGGKDDDSDDDVADVALTVGTTVGTTVGAKGGHTSIVRDIMKDQEAEAKKSDNKVCMLQHICTSTDELYAV
jgi:hypothetical protein